MKPRIIIMIVFLILVSAGLAFWFWQKDNDASPRHVDKYKNITDLDDAYDATTEIALALEKLGQDETKAAVISPAKKNARQIALTFDGLSDQTTIQQLLDILQKYNAKATFFVEGLQTAQEPEIVVGIKQAGHEIENYSMFGMAKQERLPGERLVSDFAKSQKIIKVTTDRAPTLLKLNDTAYTDTVLKAASACGITGVVKSTVYLNVKKITAAPAADQFVRSLSPGSIVSVKLSSMEEPITPEAGKTDERPAYDKQPGLKVLPKVAETDKKEIITAVDNLLAALKKANYTTIDMETYRAPSLPTAPPKTGFVSPLGSLREMLAALFRPAVAYAAEAPPQEIKTVYTTEPAIAYTFGGLTNETSARYVLERLQKLNIKATFFVTELEMKRYPQLVRQIIHSGHEIGVSIRPKDEETEAATRQTLLRSFTLLTSQFGIKTTLVHQSSGAITDATRQAVAGVGGRLVAQSFNAVQSKHKDYQTAEQVMGELFGKAVHSLNRGQIVYFRTDFYTNPKLTADMLEIIKQRKIDNIAYRVSFDNPVTNPANDSAYRIKPVGAMLKNTAFLYEYPVPLDKMVPRLRPIDTASPPPQGQLMSEAMKRYIGSPEVNLEDRMYGFSKMEERRMDKNGLIHTEEPVIFLTFDDWGTDAAINKLLYVLRKHRAAGNFFVITNNVLHNPNLLRAIAAEGHDIGSHSDKHQPMSFRDPKSGRQKPTQSPAEFFQDVTTSYQKLASVTGDVVVGGKSSLTRFFRPPTLAVSKPGFEKLFEAGYDYIISGSVSSYDYKAESVAELVHTIKNGIYTPDGKLKKGAVLVLHMSDTTVYVAMALDIILTANAAKPDNDPTKFKTGRLSDYVKDGYYQMDRSRSLRLSAPH
ncbi:polysaccharide deacetylase family protein [Sporomusa sphaeroides]|uniref:Peptidoglycan-N-acetylmuramic acid deacetylase PdaA n=1 Tax=Sporomusa sphaeroides DSM 2875 TaxID=1337886 RepID=A0ABM9W8P7_9FIRM|nr:polysaccharide deacetylase family protein [Sporomusa sphaeroides]OLS57189.1 peptidoglycan-N-acetylmuramic acid deacetylase PdaA precursor [Sporomusa sphaeroides DSM 2875]CVK21471.1 Peptidoglycan-N-acetylmuramic acid deacetylase PdaA precursor [Sporomusa sphaeroides DSM 2875]